MGEINHATEPKFSPMDFQTYPGRYGWPTQNANGYKINEQPSGTERPLKVISLGAGVGGICLAKFLPDRLRNVSLTIYDKNPEYGGTWYDNRFGSCFNWAVVKGST